MRSQDQILIPKVAVAHCLEKAEMPVYFYRKEQDMGLWLIGPSLPWVRQCLTLSVNRGDWKSPLEPSNENSPHGPHKPVLCARGKVPFNKISPLNAWWKERDCGLGEPLSCLSLPSSSVKHASLLPPSFFLHCFCTICYQLLLICFF